MCKQGGVIQKDTLVQVLRPSRSLWLQTTLLRNISLSLGSWEGGGTSAGTVKEQGLQGQYPGPGAPCGSSLGPGLDGRVPRRTLVIRVREEKAGPSVTAGR